MKTIEALNNCIELENQGKNVLYFVMVNNIDICSTLYEQLTGKQLLLLLDKDLFQCECKLIEMRHLVLIANISYGLFCDNCYCLKIITE